VLVPLAPLVDVVDDVARRAERHRDAPLRIAVTENGGRLFASHVVPRLQREGVETELLVGNAVVDLARGDADLAVRVVAPEAPELIRRRVGSVVYGLYASRAYIENAPSLVDGFRGQQVLLPAGLLATAPEATWLGMHAREARIVLRANSLVTLAHAAEADAGVVVLPVNLAFFHPRLVRLRRLDDIPGRPVWLVMHRTQQANARLRRARTVIAEALADLERRLG
jgi:DNA-binding transcriptional LysR family regulator